MAITHEQIKELIKNNRAIIDFSDYGDGISEYWIFKAEEKLGIILPNSYKWFLKSYGGGEIAGEEIYSIYGMDFEKATGGDIVYIYLMNRRHELFGIDKLTICDNDGEEIFYFATNQPNSDGEYPIYRIDHIEGTEELYANNFLEFLMKRIKFLCEY